MDPDLIDPELWELLAFHTGEHTLTAADTAKAGWGDAVLTLAAAGRLDRDRAARRNPPGARERHQRLPRDVVHAALASTEADERANAPRAQRRCAPC